MTRSNDPDDLSSPSTTEPEGIEVEAGAESETGVAAFAAELLNDRYRRYPGLSMAEYRREVNKEFLDAYGTRRPKDLTPDIPGIRRSLADVLNRPTFQPTAFLVNALLSAPDFVTVPAKVGVRVFVNWRGLEHRIRFSDLVVVPKVVAGRSVLSMPVQTWDGLPKNFSDAVDEAGGIIERSPFLLAIWHMLYGMGEEFYIVHAPVIHATRPRKSAGIPIAGPDWPGALDVSPPMSVEEVPSPPLDALSVTSLPWGGAADIGALIAERWGWSFTVVSKLEGQVFDQGHRFGHGDFYPSGHVDAAHQRHRDQLTELTERLLDPTWTGKHRVSALDFPISTRDALDRIQNLRSLGGGVHKWHNAPLVLIRVSSERIEWIAHRHSKQWLGGGTKLTKHQAADIAAHATDLGRLQDELTRRVEGVADRPHLVIDLPDPHNNQYRDPDGGMAVEDPTDEDFEAFYKAAELTLRELGLSDTRRV